MNTKSTTQELRRVIGALIFGAPDPLTVKALKRILNETVGGEATEATASTSDSGFAKIGETEILEAIDALRRELEERPLGIQLIEIAEGYRFFTDPECAPWMRHVLRAEKPARLSRPSLETLAIIAYRQPATRSEIEAVRGVSVDYVVRNLMELQLVRIVGRSELPGKPLLYGTTQRFLEHFGLKDLQELPGISELARRDREAAATGSVAGGGKSPPADAASGDDSNSAAAERPPDDGGNENDSDAPSSGGDDTGDNASGEEHREA